MIKVLVPLALERGADILGQKNFIRTCYLKKLFKYNLFPVLLSPFATPAIVEEAYNQSSGLLLMGGADINPKMYGEPVHPETDCAAPESDQTEIALVRRALEDKRPLLAICRGHQILAVASGGKLHQHLPDLNNGEEHGISEHIGYDQAILAIEHQIVINENSRAAKILGKQRASINSAHHQGVLSVGPQLLITGRTKSGVAEIIEHIDPDYFCFGIQSHPEALEDGPLEVFFERFTEACSKHRP